MTRITSIALIITLLIALGGCDRKGENIPTSPPTANSFLADGWTAFEAGDYSAALTGFTASKARDAVKENAYNGLGWTYAKLNNFDDSISNFMLLLSLTTDNAMKASAYAGLAMSYSAMQVDAAYFEGSEDETFDQRVEAGKKAISYADMALELDPGFSFSHDSKINAQTLNATAAHCYFQMKEFLKASQIVSGRLNTGFVAQLKSDQIISVRMDTVNVSVTPETGMSGTANLDVVFSVGEEDVNAQLVDVISVKNAETGVSYSVTEFDEGGKSLTFQGNPIPNEEDRYVVEYENAADYGLFLSELLSTILEYAK